MHRVEGLAAGFSTLEAFAKSSQKLGPSRRLKEAIVRKCAKSSGFPGASNKQWLPAGLSIEKKLPACVAFGCRWCLSPGVAWAGEAGWRGKCSAPII
jgi:hypothetical protein